MTAIQVNVQMVVPTEKRDEVVRVFRVRLGRIRTERGCVSCQLYQQSDNLNVLRFVEVWDDERNLQRHVRSEFFGEVLTLVELSAEVPEISFQWIAATEGLEYLAALRPPDSRPDGA